jgi:hypothetical protein
MREKIDMQVATAEAKMQLGSSSIDSQLHDIEREAMEMQLQDKLLEYKSQMGMLPASSSNDNLLSSGNGTNGANSNKNLLNGSNES